MRKIKKNCALSSAYYNWVDDLESKSESHSYDSSKNQYYVDVVMNLLHCQEGLCAYTEITLCGNDNYSIERWNNGTFDLSKGRPEFRGQLEHFDPSLKSNQRGWLWDNFFMADTDVNTKIKKKSQIDTILKPDTPEYDENLLLEYDISTHMFIANSNLGDELQQRVNSMILVLGLNYDPVVNLRRLYLNEKIVSINFGQYTWDQASVYQFPTAFNMIKTQLTSSV